jgi:uncharacterized protein (TIRG00374 family)
MPWDPWPPEALMKSKLIRYIVGLIVTVLALWLSFRNLDWAALWESFTSVQLLWVILAVICVLFTVYAMGWRWRLLLKSKKDIPLGYMFQLNVISQYINIVLPGRFGEIAKAWLLAKRYDLSGSYALGTVVIEKMFDFFAGIILWVSIPAFFALHGQIKGYTMVLVICVILIVLLVLVVWKREMVRKLLYFFSSKLPGGKFKQRVVNFLEKGMEAFYQLKDSRTSLGLALYTALIILLSTLTNFLLFLAFGFKLSFFEAMVLLLIVQAGNAPPSVPGKIGIFEYMVILGLSFFGIEKADAMGYALMLHVVSYLPKIILGFIFMANLKISIKKAESEMTQFREKGDNPPKGASIK